MNKYKLKDYPIVVYLLEDIKQNRHHQFKSYSRRFGVTDNCFQDVIQDTSGEVYNCKPKGNIKSLCTIYEEEGELSQDQEERLRTNLTALFTYYLKKKSQNFVREENRYRQRKKVATEYDVERNPFLRSLYDSIDLEVEIDKVKFIEEADENEISLFFTSLGHKYNLEFDEIKILTYFFSRMYVYENAVYKDFNEFRGKDDLEPYEINRLNRRALKKLKKLMRI